MNNFKTITLSLSTIAAIALTGCGGGGDTAAAAPAAPVVSSAQTIVDDGDFTGSGALQAATRYVANDSSLSLPSTTGLTAANKVDQVAIKTLADTKTLDITTLVGNITVNTTLTSGNKYKISGLVKL